MVGDRLEKGGYELVIPLTQPTEMFQTEFQRFERKSTSISFSGMFII